MKKGYSIFGFLFIVLLGSLLHFCYEWSGNSPIVGAFCAINESTWEHLKLFYFPFILFSGFEFFRYGKNIGNFFCVKLKSLILSMLFIVVFFYTYSGILGFNVDAVNIADFTLATALGRTYERQATISTTQNNNCNFWYFCCILIIGALFVIFTFFTPHLGIFRDPLNCTYGTALVNAVYQ